MTIQSFKGGRGRRKLRSTKNGAHDGEGGGVELKGGLLLLLLEEHFSFIFT